MNGNPLAENAPDGTHQCTVAQGMAHALTTGGHCAESVYEACQKVVPFRCMRSMTAAAELLRTFLCSLLPNSRATSAKAETGYTSCITQKGKGCAADSVSVSGR